MIKKLYILILGLALVLSASLFSVGSSLNTKSENSLSGTENSQINQSGKVLATVDGNKIYETDFKEILKAYRASSSVQSSNTNAISSIQVEQNTKATEPAEKSGRQLLTSLIKVQVITNDCQKEGIRVTREEARAALDKNIKAIKNLMQNGTALEKEQAQAAWSSYGAVAKAMGLTLDEYNENYGVTATQTILIESRHYQHFISGLSQKDLTESQINNLYDQYVQGLIQKSTITIDENLLDSIK